MSAQAYPGSTTATASNGLDTRFCTNTSVSNSPIYYYPGYQIGSGSSGYSTGTAAKVIAGGTSIEVTCTPSGTCASGNGPYSATMSYAAEVYPVKVYVAGTIESLGVEAILPGQLATATISCAADVELSNHQWTILGNKFEDFVVSASQETGKLFEFLSNELQTSNPAWRWTKEGASNVSCTVTVTYNNHSIGTANAQEFVSVKGVPSTLSLTATGLEGRHTGDLSLSSIPLGQTKAVDIVFSATTPADFVTAQGNSKCGIAQLIDWLFTADGAQNRNLPIVDGAHLDNVFPATNNVSLPGWFYADGSTCTLFDGPSYGIEAGHSTSTTRFDAMDKLMFRATPNSFGAASSPVPRKEIWWKWKTSHAKENGSWVAAENSITEDPSSTNSEVFPQWKHKTSNFGSN